MKLFFAVFFYWCSLNAFAAGTTIGLITGFLPYSQGDREILIFKLENSVAEGCNTTARFAMDSESKRYEVTVAAVLAAYHSQTSIKVKYLDTCDTWHNSADVNFICSGNINC